MSENELWNELGNLYFLSGSYDQAVHAYNKAIQLDSEYGKPYSNLAMAYAKQGKYEDAIHLYKRSLEHLTDDMEKAITWNRLGTVYRQLKEYKEAVFAFQRADELRSNLDEIQEPPNQLLYVSSESETLPYEVVEDQHDFQNHSADYIEAAEPEFDEYLPELVPVDAEVLVNEVHHEQHNSKMSKFENSAESLPEYPVEDLDIPTFVRSEFGSSTASIETNTFSQYEAERAEETEENVSPEGTIIEETIQTQESSSVPIRFQINAGLDTAANEVALTDLETGIRPETDAPGIEFSLPKPIALAEEEIETFPDELTPLTPEADFVPEEETVVADSREAEAGIKNDANELDRTEEHLLESVSDSEPVDTIIHETANENSQEAEREIGAEEEILAKQIEINPRSATTWEALGMLYKTTGRYEEAVQAFEQAISISPTTISYYHNLGLVFSARGDNKDAFNTFQKVLELDPDHSLTHASLGGYYKKIGLDELAQKHIGKAMKHIYESENEYNRACLDAICGNTDEAIDLLRVALENEQTYVNWVLHDPDLDALREDERFKQLISEYNK